MQKEIFDSLVAKYLAGQISEDEKQLLEEYLKRMSKQDPGKFSPLQTSQITDSIYQKIQKELNTSEVSKTYRMNERWLKTAVAAAAILLLLVGGYYKYEQSLPRDKIIASGELVPPAKLFPGTDKAILTLGDGTHVLLDTVGNDVIALQGITKVINDGKRLVYDASGQRGNLPPVFNTISTPRGGQYQVILADGTQVWLNAMASIRFPTTFTGKNRHVEITGEAYFEVAKDETRPFLVNVKGVQIEVLGTHFNINAYADETMIRATLLEGSVKVQAGNQVQLLSPGQQAGITENNRIRLTDYVNIEQVVAWKNGQFHLTGVNIREVMRQIGRWYGAEVEYEGDVSGINFYGVVSRTENISDLLKIMEKTGIVHFRVDGQKIIVSK